uniref:Uncharacterized protein n=1 Tax=Arundo donax TaxID=35708 RepID=A0A0A9A376_ARUDO
MFQCHVLLSCVASKAARSTVEQCQIDLLHAAGTEIDASSITFYAVPIN